MTELAALLAGPNVQGAAIIAIFILTILFGAISIYEARHK